MRKLFLLRHAKADTGSRDQSRPLAPRGKRDAFWLGQYLKKAHILPDYILCSSATRARETLSQMQDGAETPFDAAFQDDLYLASPAYMMGQIQCLPPNIAAPMIIAHNPGLSMLFQDLAHTPPRDSRSLKYPTGMLALLDFDITGWSALKSHMGQIVKLIIPSDITGHK